MRWPCLQKKTVSSIQFVFFAKMLAEEKIRWMRRAFQLARMGSASVAPNPMVGCVLVHPMHGLIGEGWHQAFGKAHAEVNAISSVINPERIAGSTAILNLEPCSHFGKTPPCANLLIEKGISEVIISNPDPNPLVAGKGIQLLQKAGIKVECGILEEEGRYLNRFFFRAQEMKRPFICLKWAQSADGFIAGNEGKQIWISSLQSRMLVHKMRSEHQAILAGRNTLRKDNPLLNLRDWPGRQPVRIVSDPNLKLSRNLQIFQDSSAATWILNDSKESEEGHVRYFCLPGSDQPEVMLGFLWKTGIHSILVEGGSQLLTDFLSKGLWDETILFISPNRIESGIEAPMPPEEKYLTDQRMCGPDRILEFRKFH